MKQLFTVAIIGILYIYNTGCKPKENNTNQEELITNVELSFKDSFGVQKLKSSFIDIDGAGGNNPSLSSVGKLELGKKYTVSIVLLNASVSPVVNITDEIIAEKEDHQFFYKSKNNKLTVEYNDADNNGKPIGLITKMSSVSIGFDTLTVSLRHLPNKNATGVSSGDITNAGGETDIEVDFPIEIQ